MKLFALCFVLMFSASAHFQAPAEAQPENQIALMSAGPYQRHESFDVDPNWDGHNNRTVDLFPPEPVVQDFGYSALTDNAGGPAGEIGGFNRPTAEPAWYAKVIPQKTFADTLTASGTLNMNGGGQTHVGFFSTGTAHGWRTANTINLRFYGRGGVGLGYLPLDPSVFR